MLPEVVESCGIDFFSQYVPDGSIRYHISMQKIQTKSQQPEMKSKDETTVQDYVFMDAGDYHDISNESPESWANGSHVFVQAAFGPSDAQRERSL